MFVNKIAIIRALYLSVFSLLLVSGVLSPFENNLIPAIPLLEALFLITAVSIVTFKIKLVEFLIVVISVIYVTLSFLYAVYFSSVHVLDFLQAYKAFIYLPFLVFFVNRNLFEINKLYYFYNIALLFFALKYSYSRLFYFSERLYERPAIMAENNFELMLLIIPLFLFSKFKMPNLNKVFMFVFFIVLISGSRSALLALIVYSLFEYLRGAPTKKMIAFAFAPFFAYAVVSVFIDRMNAGSTIEDIDRFKLFLYFVHETEKWNFADFLFGAPRITQLSYSTCGDLWYYSLLYSFRGDDSCYSVILHSYLMRVLFDHGIIGTLFLFGSISLLLKKSGFSQSNVIGVILCMLASALSVSSINSVFVAIALSLVLASYDTESNNVQK